MTEKKLTEALDFIQKKGSFKPQVGITLGSGLSSFAQKVTVEQAIAYNEIPHFSPPTVEGHPGQLILGHVDKIPVAVLQGRIHYYEGHDLETVVFPTRLLALLGIHTLILTNAAGGIDPRLTPGSFMVIKDHINLTGVNPLRGPNNKKWGPRFPDMSHTYTPQLRQQLARIMKEKNMNFIEGVYCGVSGPTYETPAEIQFFNTIGGHAVGMSTVPEAIVARHMGLKIAGISCVTNPAAGVSDQELTHQEVTEVAKRVEQQFCDLLFEFVQGV